MMPLVRALLAFVSSLFRSRVSLQLEILALQHQLAIYHRSIRRPQVRLTDRLFWSWLSRGWSRWREALVFVQPATVLAWQRKRFRDHWAHLSRRHPGRPAIPKEVRELIRDISAANPQWGSPRILGEVRKLGIPVAKSTVETYRVRPRRPPSPAWRTFLKTHVTELVALDFFTVPTVGFKVLFVLIVLAHNRRKVVHFNVTEHPTAQWTAQQLVEAFPWDTPPKVPPPRSRCSVWRVLSAARDELGDGPSAHCPSESLAKCDCGAGDREDPAGVPGSGGGFQRGSPSAPLGHLLPVLSPVAHTSVAGDGLP